jgi:multiple sugar transport system substrate-binding protein
MAHTGDTFTTPVFNGSASLRDAAGQMIENVAKSTRRKETVDEAYMEKLFADVRSLYRLDQIGEGAGGRAELGPLPETAVILLCALAAAWLLIGLYGLRQLLKKRRNAKNS